MALALIIGGSLSARPQSPDEARLGLCAVRYYRATPAAVQTLVDVFCRVPLTLVSPLGGEGSGAAFRVAVAVRGSNGPRLTTPSWSGGAPARGLRARGPSACGHPASVVQT